MPANRPSSVLLVALLLLPTGTFAAGSVFKWVDRNGVVHYDDQTRLAQRLTRATIASRFVAADAKATAPADFVGEVARQCRDLRERSTSFEQATELYGRDPGGNQFKLTETQAALERAQLADKTWRYCRPLAAQHLLTEARVAARAEAARSDTAGP